MIDGRDVRAAGDRRATVDRPPIAFVRVDGAPAQAGKFEWIYWFVKWPT